MLYHLIFCFLSAAGFFLAGINTQYNNISSKRKAALFLSLFLIMSLTSPFWGQLVTPLCFLVTIFLLTWHNTYKIQTIISFLIGYLLLVCSDYLLATCMHTLSGLTIVELRKDYLLPMSLIYVPFLYLTTRLARYILHEKLRIQEQRPGRLTIMLLLNLSVSAVIFIFAIIYGDRLGYPPNVVSFNFVLFALYFLSSTLLLYFTGKTIQKDNQLELELVQYENLNTYTKEVEQLYQEMRAFRHDYIDLLTTLKGYIDQEDNASLKEYFYQEILPAGREMTSSDYRLGLLSRIKDTSLKSLLAAKLMAAHSQGSHVHIEINEDIQEMPVKMIDLIRVLGIFLTNAIEAAEESEEKELDLAMIRESDQTAVLIRNTTKPLSLSVQQLMRKDVSTKEGHSGLGLDTARRILDSYPNIQWKLHYDAPYFLVQIRIADQPR